MLLCIMDLLEISDILQFASARMRFNSLLAIVCQFNVKNEDSSLFLCAAFEGNLRAAKMLLS